MWVHSLLLKFVYEFRFMVFTFKMKCFEMLPLLGYI